MRRCGWCARLHAQHPGQVAEVLLHVLLLQHGGRVSAHGPPLRQLHGGRHDARRLLMEPSARSASREAPFELDIMLVRFPAACRPVHQSPAISSCLSVLKTKQQNWQCCYYSCGLVTCPAAHHSGALWSNRAASQIISHLYMICRGRGGLVITMRGTPDAGMASRGAAQWTPGVCERR